MSQPPSFGRRTPATLAASPAPRPPSRTQPSLGGKKSAEDKAELRAFKRGFRRRRFLGRGGWRWVGAVCLGVSALLGFMDLDGPGALFAAAGCAALLYGLIGKAGSANEPSAGA